MRFWLPVRFEPVGKAPIVTDNPEEIAMWKSQGQIPRVSEFRAMVGNRKVRVRGEMETSDPTICKALIKTNQINFDPQEAVDEGIFTAAEMKSFGHVVEGAEEVKAKEPDVPPPSPVMPDLDTMNKDHLVDWADNQDPPIRLKMSMRKMDMLEIVRGELERRESEKLSKEK